MSALGPLAAVLVLVLAVVFLLRITGRLARVRQEAVDLQVAVTDAIHRELGAIVAPTVPRSLRGTWQVSIPVPFERPDVVERVVTIAHATLARLGPTGADDIRIVLVPQARPTSRRPVATRVGDGCARDGAPRGRAVASIPTLGVRNGVQKEKATSGVTG